MDDDVLLQNVVLLECGGPRLKEVKPPQRHYIQESFAEWFEVRAIAETAWANRHHFAVFAEKFGSESEETRIEIARLDAGFTQDGIIVIAGHYDTLYSKKNFVGANDGGSSTGLLLAIADQLRSSKKREGRSVWLVWFDGEEAIKEWSDTDSTYGSRHLADKWKKDGTASRICLMTNVDESGIG